MELFTQALKASSETNALASMHTDHANMGAVYFRRRVHNRACAFSESSGNCPRSWRPNLDGKVAAQPNLQVYGQPYDGNEL